MECPIFQFWTAGGQRAIGDPNQPDDHKDAGHLYSLLENQIIPMYYGDRGKWIKIMKQAIKTGVGFTAFRMIHEYKNQYYNVKV